MTSTPLKVGTRADTARREAAILSRVVMEEQSIRATMAIKEAMAVTTIPKEVVGMQHRAIVAVGIQLRPTAVMDMAERKAGMVGTEEAMMVMKDMDTVTEADVGDPMKDTEATTMVDTKASTTVGTKASTTVGTVEVLMEAVMEVTEPLHAC